MPNKDGAGPAGRGQSQRAGDANQRKQVGGNRANKPRCGQRTGGGRGAGRKCGQGKNR